MGLLILRIRCLPLTLARFFWRCAGQRNACADATDRRRRL